MKNSIAILIVALIAIFSSACASEDVPQAHKGRMFDRTGALALYSGGEGFTGDTLNPGTYFTGLYDTVRLADCSQDTAKETLKALTQDNIQFTLDVYITFSANCQDQEAFYALLDRIAPAPAGDGADGRTVTRGQIYGRYIRPAIGEAVRQAVSPFKANDINAQRNKIFTDVITNFSASMKELKPSFVDVSDVKLNNLDFPDSLEEANVENAKVSIEKDIATAQRKKIEEQIITAKKKQELEQAEGKAEAAKIDEIGAAWKRNPEYLYYRVMNAAGAKGNMIIMPQGQSPSLILQTPTPSK